MADEQNNVPGLYLISSSRVKPIQETILSCGTMQNTRQILTESDQYYLQPTFLSSSENFMVKK